MAKGSPTSRPPEAPAADDDRTGSSAAAIELAIADHLVYSLGRIAPIANVYDHYSALSLAVRDRLQHRWAQTTELYLKEADKVVCYLSAEFLMGPYLGNSLLNLIPHEKIPRDKIALPKRGKRGGYREPDYPYKYVDEKY